MYTLNPTDIDNGSAFFNKLNANFAEAANPQSSHTDAECRTRFIAEMNKKATLLGMTGTTFYDPAGNQPVTLYNDGSDYPQMFISENANTMTAMDALRLLIYASGIQHINDAWNIQSFTLVFSNGNDLKTVVIDSTVFTSATFQSSISDLLARYDILGGKTGSMGFAPLNAHTLVLVVRSKATGKIYAATNFSTTTSATKTDNKFIEIKKALDYVDAGGANPSFSRGGCIVAELPVITPSLLNRATIPTSFAYGGTTSSYPASVSKVMTAILLCDNVLDLNQKVTVHKSDRQPPTGYNFVEGDVLTLRDLLQCMLMQSSNTSAQVIARVVGGILLDRNANVME